MAILVMLKHSMVYLFGSAVYIAYGTHSRLQSASWMIHILEWSTQYIRLTI